MQYSEARNYGFNIIIKDYARFPRYLPLPCHFEHGWTPLSNALESDLKSEKPLMLVFSKRRAEAWRERSNTPVVIMGSPFAHYKERYKITQNRNAKGTVVFPSHSTYDLKNNYSIDQFCKALKRLPKKFKPVTICLFWIDYIEKGDQYKNLGFKVVTAGPKLVNSLSFVKNYYNILSDHKYAASNEVGSYTFYAVDFGTPFFLIGEDPVIINKAKKDINVAENIKIVDFRYGRIATELFSTGPVEHISSMQKKYVQEEIGTNDCISAQNLNKLLWKYYYKNHYWTRVYIPYVFASLGIWVVFNGPWINYLIAIRNWLAKHQK